MTTQSSGSECEADGQVGAEAADDAVLRLVQDMEASPVEGLASLEPATRQCPQCGSKYPPRSQYCGNDGARLGEAVTAVTRRIADIDVGSTLGSYRLIRLLGEGGMGRVYLAEHTKLGRKVALKLLLPELSENRDAVRRFFAEAKAVSLISHENIVEITDFSDGKTNKFFIMEYLEGLDLEQLQEQKAVVPLARALKIGIQAAAAMSTVHEAGFVHRDLKPANIFIARRGGRQDLVKILDFGVAKLLDMGREPHPDSTRAGVLFGSPGYMAPEYAAGGPVDFRVDIYALGVILFEMVTGERLLPSRKARGMLIRHITDGPRVPSEINPSNVPAELDALILQCLDTQPEGRPKDMADIATRLTGIAESKGIDLEAVVMAPVKPQLRIGRMLALLLALAVASGGLAPQYLRPEMHVDAAQDATPVELVFDAVPVDFEISAPTSSKSAAKPVLRRKPMMKAHRPEIVSKVLQRRLEGQLLESGPSAAVQGFDADGESLFDPYSGKD